MTTSRADGRFSCVVVASNRGPVSFTRADDGGFDAERGTGGVVTALNAVLGDEDVWVSAAMSDEDREFISSGDATMRRALEEGMPGCRVRMLDIPKDDYEAYYNEVSNEMLWFAHHYLWETTRRPSWNAHTREAWDRYEHVNRQFAEALAEEGGDPGRTAYLIQDYHLALVPRMLRELIPDASIAPFSHTTFAGPTYLRVLPDRMRHELLRGLLGADVLGFHARGWADNFLSCARELSETRVDFKRSRVSVGDRRVATRIHTMSIDIPPMLERAAGAEVEHAREQIEALTRGRKLVLRVERLELSKNILRGFQAFELLLEKHPELRGEVTMLAQLVPSRTDLPEYRRYAEDCVAEAARIGAELGFGDWLPIEVRVGEDLDATIAAYGLYDVLLVNAVIDGLNLVSLEGPVVNRRNGVVVLSRHAGSFDRMRRYSLGVNPFDVEETADALFEALSLPDAERVRLARGLARLIRSNPPSKWVEHQLRDLERATEARPRPPASPKAA